MMDLNPIRITPLPGEVAVTFSEDFLIEVRFADSDSGETVADFTGPNAIKISDLLGSLPTAVLEAFVRETAVKMVMIAKGLS